jgi:hypothetical protein
VNVKNYKISGALDSNKAFAFLEKANIQYVVGLPASGGEIVCCVPWKASGTPIDLRW